MGLRSEIFEQPEVLAGLLEREWATVAEVARAIRRRNLTSVFLAARGSSDNAGLYAKYLWGARNRLPVALATPSLFTVYQSPPVIKDMLVVGISQSGQSPDIVSVIREGRRQGALTLAIVNDPESPLAREAELVLDTGAGPELAVAATKSYTTQLMAVAMVSQALSGESDALPQLARVPELVRQALSLDAEVERAVERFAAATYCVVLGRGYNYATAFEWALKLKELARVIAQPYSSADFQHGPVALVSEGFPVLALAPDGAVFPELLALLSTLVGEHRVELAAVSDRDEVLSLANTALRLPRGIPEWLSPLVYIVPAQLFCYHLTRAKGYDTENPRGLQKVTSTW
jgi:glucosamine--fructose-6-phosphate aminotransferase (isomerizing)